MRTRCWLEKYTERLDGRLVAITGATGGLGGELCRHLLALGASLVLLDRNRQKSDALKAALETEYAGVQITQVTLDLSDISSVRSACEVLETMPIDVLIHNAGAYSIPRKTCDTGYDNVFQINFVSPYYMTRRLLPLLRARRGRVVAVGSIAHRYSKIDAQDMDFSGRSRASLVYGNAKRHLMYALWSLFEGEEEASLAVTHPGITFTGITAHYPPWLFAIIKHPMKVIFMRPRRAALSVLRGVFAPTGMREWWGPRLFEVWGLPALRRVRSALEREREEIAARAARIYQQLE
ncbi:MAG: SDR family NAD(P)-dependent oxidoreductase [Clostridia bacterium]|nr:SDR family NAD(P)-dependent oxidoreductase [Clostridia bacterium]